MRSWAISAAILAAGSATPALAQIDAGCTAATAQVATVAAIAAAPERFANVCVQIDGVRSGTRLFANNAALYARERRYNDASSSGVVLGVDSPQRAAPPQWVRIVARVDDCARREARERARLARANPIAILMLTGYCHSAVGPVLGGVTETLIDGPPLVRMMRADLPVEAGDLAPMGDRAVMAQFVRIGGDLFTAIRNRDRAALATALRPDHGGGQRSDDDIALLVARLLDRESPIAVINPRIWPQIVGFGFREPAWADATWRAQRTAQGLTEGFVCGAGASDAHLWWPVHQRDAHFMPGRPYGCVRLTVDAAGVVVIDVPHDDRALPEPAR